MSYNHNHNHNHHHPVSEKDVKEMEERIRSARKDMAQRRIDGLWESAQQAGFDEDELSAIREEVRSGACWRW